MILNVTIIPIARITEHNLEDNTKHCACVEGWAGPTCTDRECAFDEEEYYFGIFIILNPQGDKEHFCEKKDKCDDESYCKNNGKLCLNA
ncbi:hypothetical protein HZS_7213 [Henneguya salminicola]|nr:hypothetical protein HZS_7213 [Henneguya salminicola]